MSNFMSNADIVKRYKITMSAVKNYLYRKYGGYCDKLFELYLPCDVILLARYGSIHPFPLDSISCMRREVN